MENIMQQLPLEPQRTEEQDFPQRRRSYACHRLAGEGKQNRSARHQWRHTSLT